MQLIMESENMSLNINEKMSELDQESLNKKPLINGETKNILDEVDEKTESNGTSDKENLGTDENILNDEIGNQKGVGDVLPTEKSGLEIVTSTEKDQIDKKSEGEKVKEVPQIDVKEKTESEQKVDPHERENPLLVETADEENSLNDITEEEISKLHKNNTNNLEEEVDKTEITAASFTTEIRTTQNIQGDESKEEVTSQENNEGNETEETNNPAEKNCENGDEHETINQLTEKNCETKEKCKSSEENIEPMEVDETDQTFSPDQSLEKDITQSISDMVENIVKNFDEDSTDDFIDKVNLECNVENEQKISDEKATETKLDEEKLNDTIVVNEDKMQLQEPTLIPETDSRFEDEKTNIKDDQIQDSETKLTQKLPELLTSVESADSVETDKPKTSDTDIAEDESSNTVSMETESHKGQTKTNSDQVSSVTDNAQDETSNTLSKEIEPHRNVESAKKTDEIDNIKNCEDSDKELLNETESDTKLNSSNNLNVDKTPESTLVASNVTTADKDEDEVLPMDTDCSQSTKAKPADSIEEVATDSSINIKEDDVTTEKKKIELLSMETDCPQSTEVKPADSIEEVATDSSINIVEDDVTTDKKKNELLPMETDCPQSTEVKPADSIREVATDSSINIIEDDVITDKKKNELLPMETDCPQSTEVKPADSIREVATDSSINIIEDDVTTDKKKNELLPMETECPQSTEVKPADSIDKVVIDSSINIIEDDVTLTSSDTEKVTDSVGKDDVSKIDSPIKIPEAKDTSDAEEVKLKEDSKDKSEEQKKLHETKPEKVAEEQVTTPLIKLSNTMDILSDEEDEPLKNKQCINIDDDDDVMVIDEDTSNKETFQTKASVENNTSEVQLKSDCETNVAETKDEGSKAPEVEAEAGKVSDFADTEPEDKKDVPYQTEATKPVESASEESDKSKLIPDDFFKRYKRNLVDMTRDDLEEFCILKIVESIIQRSNLNEIRAKLKTMGQTIEEYKKKAMMLSKQNRDLQVVLKSVQEEQKKSNGHQPITPLKITRSVGMQVLMTDKNRRRNVAGNAGLANANLVNNSNQANNRNARNTTPGPRAVLPQKVSNNQTIPVPKLVPAGMNAKAVNVPTNFNNVAKHTVQNGSKTVSPAQKPEKRTHSRMQSQSSSVTVDLTDDEPPAKVPSKSSPAPPVRLVNPQNLLAPRQQFQQQVNSPKKVYIPISLNTQQNQSVRPGQALMVKTVTTPGARPRGPTPSMVRAPHMPVKRMTARHPAPLPDVLKQYQPPNWKALPPAPDLKLSKVENGIVISWKIEGYEEDSYETIASYQLYAYQETSIPPSTTLWKKIGDVKALPLPMACTLTQFMAGYKYYFAVRAVDIRSRLGPFSLPGSILLLNKM